MEQALREELGDRLRWPAPKGGFFIWATLPDTDDDDEVCWRVHSSNGSCSSSAARSMWMASGHDRIRLSFSAPRPSVIREGARRLAAALKPVEVGAESS